MTQEKIKGLLAQIGLIVAKISDGVLWTFKIANPLNTPLEKGVEVLTKAGYIVEHSGIASELSYIRVINPKHAEKKSETAKTITIEIDIPQTIAPEPDLSGTVDVAIDSTISNDTVAVEPEPEVEIPIPEPLLAPKPELTLAPDSPEPEEDLSEKVFKDIT